MKSIVRDNDGTLSLRIKILGCRFNEKTGYPDSPQNRSLVKNLDRKVRQDLQNGVFDHMSHFPHSRNASILKSLKSRFLSPGWRGLPTFESYYKHQFSSASLSISEDIVRLMIDSIGHLKVDEVVGYHLINFVDALREKMDISQRSVEKALSMVFDVLNCAALQYVFPRPFRFVPNCIKLDDYPLTHQDIHRITNHVPVKYREYFLFKYYLGISTSELLSLKWSDYDLHTSTFRLQHKQVYVEPYSRRLLFHKMKKTGNFSYVFSGIHGKKRSLNLIWVHKICWPQACLSAGFPALGINELKRASVAYLFESGLSIGRICCQTELYFRPMIHSILTKHLLNPRY